MFIKYFFTYPRNLLADQIKVSILKNILLTILKQSKNYIMTINQCSVSPPIVEVYLIILKSIIINQSNVIAIQSP